MHMRGREGEEGRRKGRRGMHETVDGAEKRGQRKEDREKSMADGWAERKMGNSHGTGDMAGRGGKEEGRASEGGREEGLTWQTPSLGLIGASPHHLPKPRLV